MKRKKSRSSKFCKDIFQRMGFKERIQQMLGYLIDSITSMIPDKVFSRLELFFFKKWKRSAKKIIRMCKEQDVDPRYYLVRTLPEEEQYNFAKSMDFADIYVKMDECPEVFIKQYAKYSLA